ncbi:DUF427 domain-containing protein [Rhodococcus gannanensis]|uniref:DUF427 domain-containing protein n=1 Tax=Rhodococcus gannanensis TaxID=1960308 RepID=A0ABW4P152_9NOCA
MTLTAGRGPLSADPAGWFSADVPEGLVLVEPHPRRILAVRDGEAVIDTERALMVHRAGSALAYVFPTGETGDLPTEPEPEAPGYVRVPWDAVDSWYEEGRKLVHYPPNPYHRVDCRPTTRALRVDVAGVTLVDTADTVILFETALDPVLYVSPTHVLTEYLRPSDLTTYCNYKGPATYWTAVVGDTIVENVAWSYESALPESSAIGGFLSFDPSKAEVRAELPARPREPRPGRP